MKDRHMFDIQREELIWGGRKLVLETGKIARQADGAVVATYGETTVLATVVSAKEPKAGIDFFPLTVNYQERTYAAGRIPGGYFKREGRPTEKETLVSRLIDRPIRPLFVEGYTQRHPGRRHRAVPRPRERSRHRRHGGGLRRPDALGRALHGPDRRRPRRLYRRPVQAEPAAARRWRPSTLDLVVAGTADAVLMVESEAKELAEDVMLGAVMFGHKHFQPVIEAIIRLAEKAAKEPRDFTGPPRSSEVEKAVLGDRRDGPARRLQDHPQAGALRRRRRRQGEGDGRAAARPTARPSSTPEKVKAVFKEAQAKVVRWNILDDGQAHRRPRRRARCARSCPRSASCRAPTARRCSPAARRRRWS